MDLIYQNPFRILGIPVTATDRGIVKHIGEMEFERKRWALINGKR